MKRTIALLVAFMVVACSFLSGCGAKAEVEFGAKVGNFISEVSTNANAIYTICVIEYECLDEDGIGAEEMDEEYYNKCLDRYSQEIRSWAAEGDDITDYNISTIIQRCRNIEAEYEEIMAIDVNAENASELKDAVQRIFTAHQHLVVNSTFIYGPADAFLEDCGNYFTDMGQAHSDACDLLQPYYQKPGFVNALSDE